MNGIIEQAILEWTDRHQTVEELERAKRELEVWRPRSTAGDIFNEWVRCYGYVDRALGKLKERH